MPIDFDAERWDRVKQNTADWWDGKLGRPLVVLRQAGRDPGRPEPDLPAMKFAAAYDLAIPAEKIVDRWDYDLSRVNYFGDAFPCVWPNFGAGIVAAFLGARVEARPETVWFHAPRKCDIRDLHFEYDADNVWLNHIKAICRAAIDRWGGLVQVATTDLGGTLDILSSFLPSEQLLLDLYDHPDHVERLTWEIHELWHRYFLEISEILQPANPGYTAWDGTFCEEPFYMLQCDFCYMIGPEMFDRFVKGELAASCKRLARSFYHLDGPGQLPHLRSLLDIDELDGVQWIFGDGQPRGEHWMDVYETICASGKRLWIAGSQGEDDLLPTIIRRTDAAGRIVFHHGIGADQDPGRVLERLGAR